jgi:methyltransferase (TIGR00027 family)
VKDAQASRTALLIAASLVLLHYDPKYSRAVSETSAALCARVLKTHSWQTRLLLKIVRQGWFRAIAKAIERITIPGILLHYALRKKCIAQLARAALIDGTKQVVIIGAGFDSLGIELSREFPGAQFWEIDHPATQSAKLRAVSKIDNGGFHLLAMDLSVTPLGGKALMASEFDPVQPTFWVAEGLLMYLPAAVVSSLMMTLRNLCAPASQVVFTFMERQNDGRIRFRSQSKLVDSWLRKRGEPFLWGITRDELVDFLRPWRVVRFFDDNNLRETEPGFTGEPIASGELICLAEK